MAVLERAHRLPTTLPRLPQPGHRQGSPASDDDPAAAPMGEARILIFADNATILVRDRYDRLTSEPCRPGSFGVAAIDRMFPAHHPNDDAGNPIRGRDCIDRNMGQRAGRHSCVKRLIGILHDRRAALSLDRRQARCAVVASPRRHDANHAATCRRSGASEQDVHRRPVAVLMRTYGQLGAPIHDLQMTIRRRDDDLAGTKGGPVARRAARQRAQTIQYSRERARASGRQMEHHAYRCWESAGSPPTTRLSVSTPPAEAPITTRPGSLGPETCRAVTFSAYAQLAMIVHVSRSYCQPDRGTQADELQLRWSPQLHCGGLRRTSSARIPRSARRSLSNRHFAGPLAAQVMDQFIDL